MAYLLVIVINKTDKLNKILERLIEVDVRGATIIDSIGMGRTLEPESQPSQHSLEYLMLALVDTQRTKQFLQ